MGTGLGKNSPVVLSLGRENYEALIDRHGQWVRWRVATKCPCVKPSTQQPDIHCDKCGGLGVTYSYQPDKVVSTTVMVKDSSGIVEIDPEYINNKLVKVYDNSGIQYPNAEKQDCYIMLNNELLPVKGVYITVVMVESIVKNKDEAICEKVGTGYYRIKGLEVSKNNIEGVYYTAPCDIIKIESVQDANGELYEVKELRQNCFYIEPHTTEEEVYNEETEKLEVQEIEIPIAEPLKAINVDYIQPFTFALLSQNLNKTDAEQVQEQGGDAVLSYPYNCNVANDDVITVLTGTYTNKQVINRKVNTEYDVIPAYFVQEVISCIGLEREYIQDKDFILVGTNRIKWICDDMPEDGEAYSITYNVYPTYKICKNIPMIRTSENQRMPKKAIIKLYDTYGEKRGINRQ